MSSLLALLSAGNLEKLSASVQKEIYKEYYELVYGTIYYMVRDHAAAEDIIQDSFLKVALRMPEIEGEAKIRNWIRKVVKNTVYSYLRKNKKNRNEIDVDSVLIHEEAGMAQADDSVEKSIELKFMTEAVGQCLSELKPEYQALIELRWKQELSYKEIADVLDTSEEKVKHKLHRAREAMRKRFHKLWGEPADVRRVR